MDEIFTVYNVSVVFATLLVFMLSFLLGRKLITDESFAEILKSLLAFLAGVVTLFKFSDKS